MNRAASMLLVGVAALVLAAASTAANGFPPPEEHDEYSYLLGAETFLNGRLTNPPHPMWRHFDTFHVLQQPTYASKYPPANALVIAAGWKLSKHPIVGVWLGFVFMCVALCWMLQAWIGPQWGLGVTLAFSSWASLSYWSYSYWGGAVAAGAGALTIGALFRIVSPRRRPTAGGGSVPEALSRRRSGWDLDGASADSPEGTEFPLPWSAAVTLGFGLIVLANSRPYEGFLLALAVVAVLANWLFRDRNQKMRNKITRVVAPLCMVGVVGLICMGTYNRAVTGSWSKLPYTVYQNARGNAPLFLWQQPAKRAPVADVTMQSYMNWEDSTYQAARSVSGRVDFLETFVSDFVKLIIPGALLLPLLLIPLALRDRWTRFSIATIAGSVIGMGLCAYFLPHYAAPLVGLVLVVYGTCLRWLAHLRAGDRPVGRWFAIAIVALWFLMGVQPTTRAIAGRMLHPAPEPVGLDWPRQRRLIADTLAAQGRRNVVIVRYGPDHGSGNEWVYNAANIDASRVVWARDLGRSDNQELLDYYHDRAAWIIDVNEDSGPYTVRPYTPEAAGGRP